MPRHTAGKTISKLPRISRKADLAPKQLKGLELFVIQGVLTPQEAQRIVDFAEGRGFEHHGSRGPAYGEALRDNGRQSLDDLDFAQHLWKASGLQQIFADISISDGRHACGLNANIRLYRYLPGQKFGRHYDDAVQTAQGETAYTLLVYLNGGQDSAGLVGGETVFYGAKGKAVAAVKPQVGLALLLKHGDDCLLHEALVVKSGAKYVLRSDVVFA